MLRALFQMLRHDRGSVIPLIALTLFSVTGLTGIAVDSGRAYLVQSRLLTAVDAAGLAAGSTVNTQNVQAEVDKYLKANYPDGYVDSHITKITAVPSADKSKITISATATIPTVFMGIFGHDLMSVKVDSEITRTSKGMELALVLDVTGSMDDSLGGGVTKLSAAKTAAHNMLGILYGSRDTVDKLWVGLVPFSQAVNVGPSRTAWLDQAQYVGLGWGTTSWAGGVQAREAVRRDTTEDTPATEKFKAYYWPDDSNNDWVRVTATPVYTTQCEDKYCGKGKNKYVCGQTCQQVIDHYENVTSYVINSTHGPNLYCPRPILPMTSSRATVDAEINQLQAGGNTHIVLGAVWGWRLLSPLWRNLWGGAMNTAGLPLNYNAPLTNKVMVLMTDGDNTISNSAKGGYGYLSEGRLNTTNQATAETRLNTRLNEVCTSMKSNNVIIYTIAFGTNISSTSQTMLRNCASQADFFFNSPTNEDLNNAFKIIGDSLANLRVSK